MKARKSDLAQQKINMVAIAGLLITLISSIGTLLYATSSFSIAMGQQAEAIKHVGDGLKDMKSSFDAYKKEMGSKVDGVRNDLTAIQGQVKVNAELNKQQVDANQAELIATKVFNASYNKNSARQDVKVYR